MEMTLLLNSTYEPLRVVHWQKAIALLWQGKVEVLEVYDREVHGVSISFKLPSVMRLLKLVRLKDSHRAVKFSRINIFTRDGYTCQYCRSKFRTEELTFDHVVPIAKGGRKTWENIVTACWRCNNKKSGRTPKEAGMRLMKRPVKPRWSPIVTYQKYSGKLAGLFILEYGAGCRSLRALNGMLKGSPCALHH